MSCTEIRIVREYDDSPAIEEKLISDIINGRNSVKILRKTAANNPKIDLVNADVHTKFGQILSIRQCWCAYKNWGLILLIGSQDIEQKWNSDINQGL